MQGINIYTLYEDKNKNKVYVMALAERADKYELMVVCHDFSDERLIYVIPEELFLSEYKEIS